MGSPNYKKMPLVAGFIYDTQTSMGAVSSDPLFNEGIVPTDYVSLKAINSFYHYGVSLFDSTPVKRQQSMR